jgi:hypothetical protein
MVYRPSVTTKFISDYSKLHVSALEVPTVMQCENKKYLRPSFFRNVTQCRLVVCYRRFGTTRRSHLSKGQAFQEQYGKQVVG